MTDTRDIQSVVEAAEQAAGAGDYASAERLLTEVAGMQEDSLGPLHPDLANTLNNLAIVCEITEKPADAERHFRRAYAIATAALEPDHPFVATSRKNLEDFCNTRGIAVDEPPAPPPVAVEPVVLPSPTVPIRHDTPPPPAAPSPVELEADDQPAMARSEPPTAATRGRSGPIVIGGLIVGGLLVTLLATAPWRRESVPADSPAAIAAERREPVAAAPKPENIPTPSTTASAPPAITPAPAAPPPDVPPPVKAPPARTAPSKPPEVAAAQLCETLSTSGNWRCVAPTLPVGPGPVYFYSRVKSATDTTVQHRWYRGDRLRQAVSLRISANPGAGYRTYSRQTVDGEGSADWRVELRTSDGIVLHEERFVVR